MQLPTIKSISDVRKDAAKYFKSIVEENESLWEELEMARSKKATKNEKSYKLEDVISGEVY